MGTVALIKDGIVEKIEPHILESKKAKEIRQIFFSDFTSISIRYKNYQEKLDDDVVVLADYPDIVQVSLCSNEYFWVEAGIVGNKDDDDNRYIIFRMITSPEKDMPNFIFEITPKEYSKSVGKLLEKMELTLDPNFSDIKILLSEKIVSSKTKVFDLFNDIRNGSDIKCLCNITPEGDKIINYRTNLINEIIEKEKSFIKYMESLNDFWKPNLSKSLYFTDSDIDFIFGDIPDIINVFKDFCNEMDANNEGYQSQVIAILYKHVKKFDIVAKYISNHPLVVDMLIKKATAQYNKFMEALSDRFDGTDFQSYLINPIQHIPRFRLFIKELRKCTVQQHPDFQFLDRAHIDIVNLNNRLDLVSFRSREFLDFNNIEKSLTHPFKIIVPGRTLIHKETVLIKLSGGDGKKEEKPGYFLVCTDIIILIINNGKKFSVIFDAPKHQFNYIYIGSTSLQVSSVKDYNNTLIGGKTAKQYVVFFNTKRELTDFLSIIEQEVLEFTENQEKKHIIQWSAVNREFMFPYICDHSSIMFGKEIITFGGQRDNSRVISSLITCIGVDPVRAKELKLYTKGVYGHCLVNYGDHFYVIGGKNKQKFFKKFLCYDLVTQAWSQVILSGIKNFTPRYGHAVCGIGDSRFLIFGGRSNLGYCLNDLFIFNCKTNTVRMIGASGDKPQPRYRCGMEYCNGKVYMCGGKNKTTVFSDFYIYDVASNVWKKSEQKITPRYGHALSRINDYILIIGGFNGEEDVSSFVYSVKEDLLIKITDIGNFPSSIKKFSLVTDGNSIYLYGGLLRSFKIPSGNLYRLDPHTSFIPVSEPISHKERKYIKSSRVSRKSLSKTLYDMHDFSSIISEFRSNGKRNSSLSLRKRKSVGFSSRFSKEDISDLLLSSEPTIPPFIREKPIRSMFDTDEREEEDKKKLIEEISQGQDKVLELVPVAKINPFLRCKPPQDTPEVKKVKEIVSSNKGLGDVISDMQNHNQRKSDKAAIEMSEYLNTSYTTSSDEN